MTIVQIGLVLSMLAVWLVLAVSGLLETVGYVSLPIGLTGGLAATWFAYRMLQRTPWAMITMLIISVVGLSINFRMETDYGARGLDWQNGIKLMTWSFLALLSMVHWRTIIARCHDPIIVLFAVLFVIELVSASYSKVPTYSAACAVSIGAYLGFACLLAEDFDEAFLIRTIIWSIAGYCVINWVIAAILPDVAFMTSQTEPMRLQGISGHPNSLARQMSVLVCLLIGAHFRGYINRAFWPLLVLGSITMIATNGRTAMIAVILACVLVFLRAKRLLPLGLVAIVLAAMLLYNFIDFTWFSRTGDSNEILTLTGRTQLWSFVWEKIIQHPILGYGFNSFEATVVDEWYGNPDAGVATHNNFLEILFSCGLLGFIPFISVIAILVKRWITKPNVLRDLLVINILISSFTEVDISSLAVLPTIAMFIIFALDSHPAIPFAMRPHYA